MAFPAPPALVWTPAVLVDRSAALALMREFYREEKLPYSETLADRAVSELLATPALGVLFLGRQGSEVLGYSVATLGYSLEFGGRYVLLDELYVQPAVRGRGEGKRALACVETWAKAQGVSALRLEVNFDNQTALSLYLKSGFSPDQRQILTRPIQNS
ncbi:MAG: GNAT family N-acetyltransferase [Cyanobacteriota bacterium]|jgi:GNAT superfamily N-acetyltransferase